MSRTAALLIDLEGFAVARAEKGADVSADIGRLVRALRRRADAATRLTVQRAYVDLTAGRVDCDCLARLGLEGVHVGGGGAAVVLRLALDAFRLATGPAPVQHFVIVTGAADISPLVVDLRRQGAIVQVVGVAGRTLADRHAACDEFCCFEDIASPAILAEIEQETALVRGAVLEILTRRRPLPVVQLVEQVCKSVGRPLEIAAGGAQSLATFLREYGAEFGIVLRRGDHEVLVADLPDEGPPPPARSGGPQHSAGEYRQLLRLRNPRVHLTARDDWLRISELYFDLAGGQLPERPVVHQQELTARVVQQCELEGMDNAEKKAQSVVFQLFKSGAFVCAELGAEGDSDFHWSRPARLAVQLADLEAMRHATRVYIARVLIERMQSEFGTPEVDPEVFAEMLEGQVTCEEQIERIEELLDAAEDQLALPVRD